MSLQTKTRFDTKYLVAGILHVFSVVCSVSFYRTRSRRKKHIKTLYLVISCCSTKLEGFY